MPGPSQELATVTVRFASGQVADVTAKNLHFYEAEARVADLEAQLAAQEGA